MGGYGFKCLIFACIFAVFPPICFIDGSVTLESLAFENLVIEGLELISQAQQPNIMPSASRLFE